MPLLEFLKMYKKYSFYPSIFLSPSSFSLFLVFPPFPPSSSVFYSFPPTPLTFKHLKREKREGRSKGRGELEGGGAYISSFHNSSIPINHPIISVIPSFHHSVIPSFHHSIIPSSHQFFFFFFFSAFSICM